MFIAQSDSFIARKSRKISMPLLPNKVARDLPPRTDFLIWLPSVENYLFTLSPNNSPLQISTSTNLFLL